MFKPALSVFNYINQYRLISFYFFIFKEVLSSSVFTNDLIDQSLRLEGKLRQITVSIAAFFRTSINKLILEIKKNQYQLCKLNSPWESIGEAGSSSGSKLDPRSE